MAKDGTARGGKRTGSGRKGKSTAQKTLDGVQTNSMNIDAMEDKAEFGNVPALPLWEVEDQRMTIKVGNKEYEAPALQTDKVFRYVWNFLDKIGVAEDVGTHLVQLYAFEIARFIQVEQITSMIGFTFPHPTSGAPMASPYVNASMSYLKQANVLWNNITQVIRDKWDGTLKYACYPRTEEDDMMEKLLSYRGC